MTDLISLSALEMLSAFRSGELSPVQVTQAVLDQIAACDGVLGATFAVDPSGALDMARASEARWRAGTPASCGGFTLDGVPATIKDRINVKGKPTVLGTAAIDPTPSLVDAPVTARLREAGAVLIGKTTMPDYGMLSSGLSSFHGRTRNPWNLDKSPGGSSGGAGAAAAAGYGPLHVGTDLGGSIRLPAAWCGVVGLKPSYGRVPLDPPFMALAAGPMTRTVSDAALMMGVLSQPDAADYASLPYQDIDWLQLERDLRGVRIGLLLDGGHGLATEPETRAAIEAAARRFEAAGAVVELMKPWATSQLVDNIDRFWRTRSNADMALLPQERQEKILPFVREWAKTGAGHSGAEVFQGYAATTAMRAATIRATQPYDFVFSPVAAIAAFDGSLPMPTNDVATAMHHITFTVPFSMSEQPAISVNAGYTSDGLPIGLQIAGRRFDDLGVLQMARAWEEMRPAERPFPVAF